MDTLELTIQVGGITYQNLSRTHRKWVKEGNVFTLRNILEGMTDTEITAFWQKKYEARFKREEARKSRGGWSLAVYSWEAENYPAFYKVKYEKKQGYAIIKKLARHFKTTCPQESHVQKRGGGHYTRQWGTPFIALPANPSLTLVCHEYAHHLDATRQGGKVGHGKTFKKELKKVYTFAKRYLPAEPTN